ncbi:MAG TPA: GNAT family N-acetyltransferase, partial [Blastocatellia bacterium]|nr:GNAT family N-acetyltransferase [Blastocatellia bacterium]
SSFIRLRPVQPEDEAFLAAVYGTTRERELAMVPWTDEQRAAFIKFQCQAQLQHYQTEFPQAEHNIILFEDRPVGRIYVDRRETEIRILDITVLPQYRGQGIGAPLIRKVMEEAAQAGKAASIFVESYNPSMRLFKRLGFAQKYQDGFLVLMEWRADL